MALASVAASRASSSSSSFKPPPGREALLYTPGPLTTSASVKQAALRDLGSRDPAFVKDVVQEVRTGLLEMAHTSIEQGYETVLMQGSGTFVVESVVSSVVASPEKGGRILVVSNGAYGKRMGEMCEIHGIDHEMLSYGETEGPTPEKVMAAIKEGQSGTN